MAKTYVALLRGINVGGHHKLPMKELRGFFEDAGCQEVRSYIQSGNVVFCAPAVLAKKVPKLITAAIETQFGFEIPILIRSREEVKKVMKSNPFLVQGAEPPELHFGFLSSTPTAGAAAKLDPHRSPPDEFRLVGKEIYFRCPNGVARSKLTNSYFDSRLKSICTVRNWKTVAKLVEIMAES